jgi:hypothetical protein
MNCLTWSKQKWKKAFDRSGEDGRSALTAASGERSGFDAMRQMHKESRAKPARRLSRLKSKASAPQRLHQRNMAFKIKTPELGNRTQGRFAAAFFGASPVVASALDVRAGATLTDVNNPKPSRTDCAFRLLFHLTQRPLFRLPGQMT